MGEQPASRYTRRQEDWEWVVGGVWSVRVVSKTVRRRASSVHEGGARQGGGGGRYKDRLGQGDRVVASGYRHSI